MRLYLFKRIVRENDKDIAPFEMHTIEAEEREKRYYLYSHDPNIEFEKYVGEVFYIKKWRLPIARTYYYVEAMQNLDGDWLSAISREPERLYTIDQGYVTTVPRMPKRRREQFDNDLKTALLEEGYTELANKVR